MTSKELEEWLNDWYNLISEISICFENAQRLTKNKYLEEEEEIKKFGFFQYYWHQTKFIQIVNITKILGRGDSHKRSVHKLMNRLTNDKNEPKLIQCLLDRSGNSDARSALSDLSKTVDNLVSTHEQTITKIIKARDKIYAHKDHVKSVPNVTIEEFQQIRELLAKLYNSISLKLASHEAQLENIPGYEVDWILKNLSEYRQLRREQFKQELETIIKPKSNNSIQ